MEIVLTERSPIYQQAADFSVDTEGKKPEAIAEEIIDRMQKEGLLDD
jgi:shikimate kinase